MKTSRLTLFLLWSLLVFSVSARIEGPGEGVFTYDDYAPYADKPIDVHYFIPSDGDAATMPILFVMQGADRGWTYLMKTWKQDAQKYRFIVVIPVFTKELYPVEEYQEMGVYSEGGTLNAPERTAAILIDKMFERFRDEISGRQEHYSFYGHSAGGQFVHRALLLHDSPYVERSVVGSPGWYTFPDNREMRYPYGVTDLPYINEDDLRRFVTSDAWVQVSDGDTLRESFLRKTPEAELQGRNREERGKSFYASICKAAEDLGVENGWKFVEEHNIAHHSSGMGKRAVKYLFPDLVRRVDCTKVMTPAEVTARLQDLVADHEGSARMEVLGQTPLGQDIPAVYIGNRNERPPSSGTRLPAIRSAVSRAYRISSHFSSGCCPARTASSARLSCGITPIRRAPTVSMHLSMSAIPPNFMISGMNRVISRRMLHGLAVCADAFRIIRQSMEAYFRLITSARVQMTNISKHPAIPQSGKVPEGISAKTSYSRERLSMTRLTSNESGE